MSRTKTTPTVEDVFGQSQKLSLEERIDLLNKIKSNVSSETEAMAIKLENAKKRLNGEK